jgi:hypothetical protein
MAALIDVNSIVPPVSQIVSDQLINYVNTVKNEAVTDVDVGGKMWTFMYSSARQKVDLYYKLYQFKKQSFILYATGKYLDLHGQERGVFRLAPNYAGGIATFYREQPSPVELKIAQGIEITTTADSSEDQVITFVTTQSGSIPANQLSVNLEIKCTVPGTTGNLPSGSLNRIPTPPIGVHRVITTSTSGGTEQETDEDYRSRIIVALESLGKGTLSAITNAVRGVQGVRTVSITDPTKNIIGAEYFLQDDSNIKCCKLETLNATIAANRVTLYIRDGSESNTKRLKVWNKDSNDIETIEDFNNIHNFLELIETINSTKKKYTFINNGMVIAKLTTIHPDGAPIDDVYIEIREGTDSGLKYIFRMGLDIRTTEVYDNITNVGQLIEEMNGEDITIPTPIGNYVDYSNLLSRLRENHIIVESNSHNIILHKGSKICTGTTYIQYEETLTITAYVDEDDNDLNYVIPTYQPIISLLADQFDQDGTPYSLRWVDPNNHGLGQKIVVFKDDGTTTVRYIYDGASFSPSLSNGKLSTIFSNNGSNLIKSKIFGEKTSTSDVRKIYQIMDENKTKDPKNIGTLVGDQGQSMDLVYQNRPGSITVLPVPYNLPLTLELRNNIEIAINAVKAAGIEVIIEEPRVEFVDIQISVGLNLTVGADRGAIEEQIAENLTNYINNLDQNEPAYWEKLIAQANPDLEGLLYTEIVSPVSDIIAPVGGFLRAGNISFA